MSSNISMKVRHKVYAEAYNRLLRDTEPHSVCYCIISAKQELQERYPELQDELITPENFPEFYFHMPEKAINGTELVKGAVSTGYFWWDMEDINTRKVVLAACINATE